MRTTIPAFVTAISLLLCQTLPAPAEKAKSDLQKKDEQTKEAIIENFKARKARPDSETPDKPPIEGESEDATHDSTLE